MYRASQVVCGNYLKKKCKECDMFSVTVYEGSPSETPWNLQYSCWNENEIKWNEMWWSHSLVQDLPLCYNRDVMLGWL